MLGSAQKAGKVIRPYNTALRAFIGLTFPGACLKMTGALEVEPCTKSSGVPASETLGAARLLDLQARFADHLGPHRDFAREQLAQVVRWA